MQMWWIHGLLSPMHRDVLNSCVFVVVGCVRVCSWVRMHETCLRVLLATVPRPPAPKHLLHAVTCKVAKGEWRICKQKKKYS